MSVSVKPWWARIAPGAAAILLFAAFAIAPFYSPPKASATSMSTCTTGMGSWDWPSWVVKTSPRSGSVVGGAVPQFNVNTSSYVIIGKNTGSPGGWDSFVMFTPSVVTDKILLYMDGSGNQYAKSMTGGTLWRESINDPHTPGSSGVNYPAVFASGPDVTGGSGYQISAGVGGFSSTCIVVAHNVSYDVTWIDPTYDSLTLGFTAGVGTATGSSCGGITDIVCHANQMFQGVTDTILNVFRAFVAGFGSLFVPDGNEIQDAFDELTTTFNDHMGFLTYPIDFFVDLFAAFSSTPAWCDESSCTKDFGDLYGGEFVVDFNMFGDSFPTAWTWIKGFIQGTTVLVLILALRKKFLEVVQK